MTPHFKKGHYTEVSIEAQIGENCTIGSFCIIDPGVVIGDNVRIGDHVRISSNVSIGSNTQIMNYVEIRTNTRIGESCYIDSGVAFSGESVIGNNVTLRYKAIIARGVQIGNNTYVCPQVMTNNLDTAKHSIGGAHIGSNCFIGTSSVLNHGIVIEDDVKIGSLSFVNKNCEKGKTYIGSPAKEIVKKQQAE
jgi:UDP-2-acetamido-3-amino-2,3-dideoxy-glucuronate N-acetyltransferase